MICPVYFFFEDGNLKKTTAIKGLYNSNFLHAGKVRHTVCLRLRIHGHERSRIIVGAVCQLNKKKSWFCK